MTILTIRTDKPEAELGLFEDQKELLYEIWEAHRELAETLHTQIARILETAGKKLEDIGGIVVYKGPGSFTGLRIGISVANTVAYSLGIPIVGVEDAYVETGIPSLLRGETDGRVLPEYGAPVHITQQRK